MTIAIFSDVHANLPALEAVLEDLARRRPDMVFCLGDLVGYAPWPNEVVERVREAVIPTIAGNYDEGVGRNADDCGCAYRTAEERQLGSSSIAYTNHAVTDRTRAYLRGLPGHIRLDFSNLNLGKILLVHGSPRKINEYLFEDRPDKSFAGMMERADADVMVCGHTHRPYHKVIAYDYEGATRRRHAVNSGSVGKPKDGDPRACYVLLEVNENASVRDRDGVGVEIVRIEYDVEEAARAVEASSLPNAYADMLRTAS